MSSSTHNRVTDSPVLVRLDSERRLIMVSGLVERCPRRRRLTTPTPVLGDVARERWRAERAAALEPARRRRRQLPWGVKLLDRVVDRSVPDIEPSPWLTAYGVKPGSAGTPTLLAALEEALWAGDCRREIVADALEQLGRVRDPAAVPALISLLQRQTPPWASRRIAHVLRSFDALIVAPILTAYPLTSREDSRALLVEILTAARATHPRILTLCGGWLPHEPAFAADMMTDYGDPSALPLLHGRMTRIEPSDEVSAEHVAGLATAIEMLGDPLTRMERAQLRHAIGILECAMHERIRPTP